MIVLDGARQTELYAQPALPAARKSCAFYECGLMHEAVRIVIDLVDAAHGNNISRLVTCTRHWYRFSLAQMPTLKTLSWHTKRLYTHPNNVKDNKTT